MFLLNIIIKILINLHIYFINSLVKYETLKEPHLEGLFDANTWSVIVDHIFRNIQGLEIVNNTVIAITLVSRFKICTVFVLHKGVNKHSSCYKKKQKPSH